MIPDIGRMISKALSDKVRCRILSVLMILTACSMAYSNTLNVPFVLDGYSTVSYYGPQELLNIFLHGSQRRIVEMTFALNYQLHGMQVTGYHLVNLIIHLSASITLFILTGTALSVLRQTYFKAAPSEGDDTIFERFMPFGVALFFAIHPIQTQAVTYIVQRYTSLATLFYFLSALFFLKARMEYDKKGASTGFWVRGWICLATGVLALWSKQIAFTLPIMFCVLEVYLFRGRLLNRRFLIVSGVLFFVALVAAMFIWQGLSVNDFIFDLHAATSETTNITRSTYFLTQLRVIASYLRLLCLPVGQSLAHAPPLHSTLFALPVIASLAMHCALIACSAALFRISSRDLQSSDSFARGVLQRMASLGVVWFYAGMMVESSIIPIRDVMVEHRLYLPSAGFFLAVVSGMLLALHGRKSSFKVISWSFAIICLALVGMTVARNGVWESRVSIWQDALSKAPENPLALTNLAGAYVAQNRAEKAISLYVRALELKGDFQAFVLGEALQDTHLYDSRFTSGKEFMRPGGPLGIGMFYESDKDAYESVVFNTLGLAYEFLGEPDKAVNSYKVSLKLNPGYDLGWYNLGLLAAGLGDTQLAVAALKELRKINPDLAVELEPSLGR